MNLKSIPPNEVNSKISLSVLSISDLVTLHGNYVMVKKFQTGLRYSILSEKQFESVEVEIRKRIGDINF